jgi:hypothetical protein
MVKYKVGFTISAETLFGMLAKFLPVDDLHVEEVMPPLEPLHLKGFKRPDPLPLNKPKRKYTPSKHKRKPSIPLRLNEGINKIIMELMVDGQPHRATELKLLLKKGGYSPNSVGSRLQALEEKDIITRIGDGTWRLMPGFDIPGFDMKESA